MHRREHLEEEIAFELDCFFEERRRMGY